MRRALAAALSLAACGPLTPLPPQGAPDTGAPEVDAAADTGAPDGAGLDTAVCTYPLRVGCVGSAGCMGYRECDFTETFLGPCTCYPDAGWDRPPVVDAPAADEPPTNDAAPPRDGPTEGGALDVGADASPDASTPPDGPAADAGDGGRDAGLSPAYCVARAPACGSNADCAGCGATIEGITFCCSRTGRRCFLRPGTACMP